MKKLWKYTIIALKGGEKDFTKGSIRRALFLLSLPIVLEMMMEALFAIVDIFFISQLDNEAATSAIGFTENYMFIIMSLALGISIPATAKVARRIGEKKMEAASHAGFQAIVLTIGISIVTGVLGFIYAEELLILIGAEQDVIREGIAYTRIIFGLNVILMLLYVNNAIFRGAGDASIAMRTLWIANGINIILDPCLILGLWIFPQMGVEGAAIATCIGRSVGVLYQFYHMFNGKAIIKMTLKTLKVELRIVLDILKLSIGGAGQHLITTSSWIFLAMILAEFGTETFAGFTYTMRILAFTLLPSWGVAMAAATLVGQNLGAGQPERAEKSVWMAAKYNMFLLACISAAFIFLAKPVIGVFTEDPVSLKNGTLALQIIFAGYIFYAYEMVVGQAFNGAGDTITPTVLNAICFLGLQIPLAWYLSQKTSLGATGVYITIAICSSILAILAIIVFRRGKWKTVSV